MNNTVSPVQNNNNTSETKLSPPDPQTLNATVEVSPRMPKKAPAVPIDNV